MLNDVHKKRILEKLKREYAKRGQMDWHKDEVKDYINNFLSLSEDAHLEILTLFERIQADSIAKGFNRLDKKIYVQSLGSFKIKVARRFFVDNFKDVAHLSYKEKVEIAKLVNRHRRLFKTKEQINKIIEDAKENSIGNSSS